MRVSIYLLVASSLAVGSVQSGRAVDKSAWEQQAARAHSLTEEVRNELLEARETAWRSFFQKDITVVERILGPELIAIQQSAESWEDRARLVALARAINEKGVQILRLEFPRTEIQLFGDTAILYYSYVFETASNGRSAVDAGRGTEVFVRRGGRWVDVGWHLDNGAFLRKDGAWVRVGGPYPEPRSASASKPRH